MVIACFYEPMDNTFKPNWNKGHSYIDNLTDKQLTDVEYLGEDPDDLSNTIKKALHDKLNSVKDTYKGSRELTTLEFPPYKVFLTGGVSWGDSPSDIFNDISDLDLVGVLEEVGFNNVIDYKKIVDKILKQKVVLPMIMSLDKDLDALISKTLSKRST